jgi:hypothetical protein
MQATTLKAGASLLGAFHVVRDVVELAAPPAPVNPYFVTTRRDFYQLSVNRPLHLCARRSDSFFKLALRFAAQFFQNYALPFRDVSVLNQRD